MQYKECVFNYHLSRTRSVIENTFGIAASRFRILPKTIIAKIDTAIQVTKSVVALQNILLKENADDLYCPDDYIDRCTPQEMPLWRSENQVDEDLLKICSIQT